MTTGNIWIAEDSEKHYGLNRWGLGYFYINNEGELCYKNKGADKRDETPSLIELCRQAELHPDPPANAGASTRKMEDASSLPSPTTTSLSPILLNFPDILADRINSLYRGFEAAMKKHAYTGPYQGITPVKVNNTSRAVETIVGAHPAHGLEVGTVPEMLIALSTLPPGQGILVCNGVKTPNYFTLCKLAANIGHKIILSLETLTDIRAYFKNDTFDEENIHVGLRLKPHPLPGSLGYEEYALRELHLRQADPFGLNQKEFLEAIFMFKQAGALDRLQMVHFHGAAEIPDLETLSARISEAMAIFVWALDEGASNLNILNVGGGLAVDGGIAKPGSPEATDRCDINLYCERIVREVAASCRNYDIPMPTLVSETGRAMLMPYSVLLVPVRPRVPSEADRTELTQTNKDIIEEIEILTPLCRDIDEKNAGENSYLARETVAKLNKKRLENPRSVSAQDFLHALELMEEVDLMARCPSRENSPVLHQGYFSMFQSLPDHWGLQQIFPAMPVQRLDEKPSHAAHIKDMTCDSDGVVRIFGSGWGQQNLIRIHEIGKTETYYIGFFLVGAYQEALGAYHNLFGRPKSLIVTTGEDGLPRVESARSGDTNKDALERVGYSTDDLLASFANNLALAGGDERLTGLLALILACITYK